MHKIVGEAEDRDEVVGVGDLSWEGGGERGRVAMRTLLSHHPPTALRQTDSQTYLLGHKEKGQHNQHFAGILLGLGHSGCYAVVARVR